MLRFIFSPLKGSKPEKGGKLPKIIFMLDMVNNVLGRAGASACMYLLCCGVLCR